MNTMKWSGMRNEDYQALSVLFGFNDWREFKAFVAEQQEKADHRYLAGKTQSRKKSHYLGQQTQFEFLS